MSSRRGNVLHNWFIPGEGIDRFVISADIQRYLGNDATVRPGVGTGEFNGVPGYWIKAFRNLTSTMIEDLKANTMRWNQEQRHNGAGGQYVDSSTFARNADQADDYPMQSQRHGGQMRHPGEPMQRDPRAQNHPGQNYNPQDNRGQFPPDQGPGGYLLPPQTQNQPYFMPDPNMYGQPDAQGRYDVNGRPQDRAGQRAPPQGPPPGYRQEGQHYVAITSGYGQPGMMATSGPDSGYYGRQQPQPQRGQDPNQRPGTQPGYGGQQQPEYNNGYPSPVSMAHGPPPSNFPSQQPQQQPQLYDQFGRPIPNPQQPQQQYRQQQDSGYPPQGREPDYGMQQPPPPPPPQQRDSDRERERERERDRQRRHGGRRH